MKFNFISLKQKIVENKLFSWVLFSAFVGIISHFLEPILGQNTMLGIDNLIVTIAGLIVAGKYIWDKSAKKNESPKKNKSL